MRTLAFHVLDAVAAVILIPLAPLLAAIARLRNRAPKTRAVLDRAGVSVIRHHYYEPIVQAKDLHRPLDLARDIRGLNLDGEMQLALLRSFTFGEELKRYPRGQADPLQFGYDNGSFESGDAEILYSFVRRFRPQRVIEIGSGNSTLLVRDALIRNRAEDPTRSCRHVCIEPFEQPWLESLQVEVVRSRVELMSDALFDELDSRDILFIDSSHVIRPQGDVLHEYLYLLGGLKPGVLIHVHDVFTPRDYPRPWVVDERRLWNEQYLLEAFLCFNDRFRVVCAVNWLHHTHREALAAACPMLAMQPDREPGSFWIQRKA